MRIRQPLALVLLAALATPFSLRAQDGFLFGPPVTTLSVHFGQARPTVKGDIYDDMRDWLTLSKGDFAAQTLGGELLIRVTPKLDVGFSLDWAESTALSEFQDFTFQDDSPIEQTTMLRRVPFSAELRYYLLPRGESVSRLAWLPQKLVPFVGGGAGLMWYKLEQSGFFVDHKDYGIFEDTYESSGATLAGHLLAGAQYWVAPRVGFTAQGQYTYASVTPSGDYNYNDLDLSGFQGTIGLSVRF